VKVDRLDNVNRSTEVSSSSADKIAQEVRRIVAAELARTDGRPLPLYDAVIALVEKPLIEQVVHLRRGNLSHAALSLGIHRNTLRMKMRHYGIKAASTGSGRA
jgi:Fis family transcriptional regulator